MRFRGSVCRSQQSRLEGGLGGSRACAAVAGPGHRASQAHPDGGGARRRKQRCCSDHCRTQSAASARMDGGQNGRSRTGAGQRCPIFLLRALRHRLGPRGNGATGHHRGRPLARAGQASVWD